MADAEAGDGAAPAAAKPRPATGESHGPLHLCSAAAASLLHSGASTLEA